MKVLMSESAVPLIIDTDASFDVDDVVAICMAHALMDNGEVGSKYRRPNSHSICYMSQIECHVDTDRDIITNSDVKAFILKGRIK